MLAATQERTSADATVIALRAHAAVISTAGAQTKPSTRADFIEEVRRDMVKAMRQEIHFVMGVSPRPDMAPLVHLVHITHAIQQMINGDLSTQVLLLASLRDSKCTRVRNLASVLPSTEGRLSGVTAAVQACFENERAAFAALLDVLALSECPLVQQLRDVIASNYAYAVGPTVAASKGIKS